MYRFYLLYCLFLCLGNILFAQTTGFEKGVPEFLIEEFRMDIIFGAIDPLEDEPMPELVCPNCRAKFEYKKTDDR